MVSIRFLVLLLVAVCAIQVHGADVLPATDADFDTVIQKGKIALVKFYAPWCGHCKKLAPEWEKAAKEVSSEEVVLVDVDCTKETELAKKYEIQGYPTIVLFRDGEKVEVYDGGRESGDIVKYLNGNVGPAMVFPQSAEELNKLKEENDALCVILTTDVNSALSVTSAFVAEKLRSKMKFAVVYEPSMSPDQKPETVVVYRKADEESEVYAGAMEADDLGAFILNARVPYAGEISPASYKLYTGIKLPTLWVFLKPSEESSVQIKSQLKDVGKKMRQHMIMIWANVEVYTGVAKHLGLPDDAKFPSFAISVADKHYVPPTTDPATVESIQRFAEEYVEGKLIAKVKSQPVPATETVDGLTTVVGDTLSNHISSGKDMMIEFYAPWCGHCKKLAPIYAKVAKELEPYDVIIAAMDATENDFDRSMFEVSGFPTLYFVPHGQKPILYQGGRTFYDIYKFVREHASASQDKPIPTEPKGESAEETAAPASGKEDL